jgi:hypothetical protein
MAGFRYWNENPQGQEISDCVTRAIVFATNTPYAKVRKKLYHTARLLECEKLCPTCYSFAIQEVFGGIPIHCEGLSVGEFADKHPKGVYLIRIKGHLTVIKNAVCYDLFDCRDRECDLAWRMPQNYN